MGVRGRGDLARVVGAAVGTASMSLGLAARASILATVLGLRWLLVLDVCGGSLKMCRNERARRPGQQERYGRFVERVFLSFEEWKPQLYDWTSQSIKQTEKRRY